MPTESRGEAVGWEAAELGQAACPLVRPTRASWPARVVAYGGRRRKHRWPRAQQRNDEPIAKNGPSLLGSLSRSNRAIGSFFRDGSSVISPHGGRDLRDVCACLGQTAQARAPASNHSRDRVTTTAAGWPGKRQDSGFGRRTTSW